jgi:hypothetical protein
MIIKNIFIYVKYKKDIFLWIQKRKFLKKKYDVYYIYNLGKAFNNKGLTNGK